MHMKKLIFFIYFILIRALYPPIGNIYSNTVKFPFIGSQTIETEYINNNRANIYLRGKININGTGEFVYKKNKKNLKLSNNLCHILNKLKCELNDPYYDNENDNVILRISIKSLISKKIILYRKDI